MKDNTKATRALPVVGLAAAAMSLGLLVSPAASADTHLVGPGCAAYAQQVPTGPGSVGELAKVPVATAAANSPVLTTLAAPAVGEPVAVHPVAEVIAVGGAWYSARRVADQDS